MARGQSRRIAATAMMVGLASAMSPTVAQAHAVVVRASLVEKPPAAGAPTTAVLYFNSGIEIKFTQAFLRYADSHEVPLAVVGGTPGELRIDLPSLPAGPYVLRYRVLAADGHFTDSALRFHIEP